VIWPAFAIGMIALLLRLPTRPLRWGAIAFLLIVNCAQSYARLFAGTEPPMDRVARDIAAAQPTPAGQLMGLSPAAWPTHTRTYTTLTYQSGPGHPGTLNLFGTQSKYYLSWAAGKFLTPMQFRGNFQGPLGLHYWLRTDPAYVAADVKSNPQITRIIIWDVVDSPRSTPDTYFQSVLGPEWKQVGEEHFAIRFHWTWEERHVCRRRELVRAGN
jgi:hypothetical protein